MSNFKVDVLLKALDELQIGELNPPGPTNPNVLMQQLLEKSQNEQLLAEEHTQRKKIEHKTDSILSTLTLTSERDAKSKEAFKMEEQRVQKTQIQIHMYKISLRYKLHPNLCSCVRVYRHEKVNAETRERITQLNNKIKQSEKERESNM